MMCKLDVRISKRRFVIGREKPGEQSEVAQLIQQTLEQERWQREMMEQRYNQYMDEQEVSVSVVVVLEKVVVQCLHMASADVRVQCLLIHFPTSPSPNAFPCTHVLRP